MKLSIIIPIYNEESTIISILKLVEESLSKINRIDQYEIILIDDCSKDQSFEILKEYIENKKFFKLLKQNTNMGKGAAITRGFEESVGDIVLVQDADLEYDPFEYPILLAPFFKGVADVVYGSRFKGETNRVLFFWHSMGNRFLTFLSNCFTNLNLTDMETCYKVFRGDLIRNMVLTSKRFGIEPEVTAKISKVRNLRIYEVPISYFGRTYDEGKKIGWKDGVSALWSIIRFNLLTSYSQSFKKLPLKLDSQFVKNSSNE